MLQFVHFVSLAVVITSVLGDCDKFGVLLYEDLGCTPEYGADKTCPIKYTCKGLEPSEKYCYFRGRIYESSERVESRLSSPSCDEGCFCRAGDGRAGFTCAVLDCPEWLGVPVEVGCYRNYSLEQCCSVGQICPPFDNVETCTVEGKEYKEGEQFYPSNTCFNCVCQKGFKGKFEEPFCKRRSCGQQLRSSGEKIQKSCGAFYSKELHKDVMCCADDWICANGTEAILGKAKSDNTCKFGGNTLKVGQFVEKLDITDSFGRTFEKVKCECVIPPLTKCVDV